MTLINNQLIISDLDRARLDPAGQQRLVLSRLEGAVAGDQVLVDPSNPYMFLMEAAVTTAAYSLLESEVNSRRQYPSLAVEEEDIYLHMTDRDFVDRFAQPPFVPVTFLFSVEEIKANAVDTGVGNIRKLTIPKNAELSVGGVAFTMEYPIDMRVMAHGGISVVYGEVENTPLHVLTDNTIQAIPTSIDAVEMIMFTVPIYQFQITSNLGRLLAATVYNESFTYTDKFYYCRCYMQRTDGTWKEIRTTHTDQVFDPTVPTALLKVYAGRVWVKIPQIYYTSNLVTGDLRVDIYTTRAEDNFVLSSFDASDWTARWVDVDETDGNKYTAPMILLNTTKVLSSGVTSGARAPLSVAELRERVMQHNQGQIVIPITNVQVDRRLTDQGYEQVTDVDLVTNRVIWGTKPMPLPVDNYTVTPAAAGIEQIILRMTELQGHYGVSDNGPRMTLHPSLLFRDTSGAPVVVSQMELDELRALRPDGMARRVTGGGYLYTPFHYVLDTSDELFSSKAYYLDSPSIDTRQFITENDTTGIELAAGKLAFTQVEGGYKLQIVTVSGDTYKNLPDENLYVQLAFTPPGEDTMAYLNGTLLGTTDEGERVWEFFLGTDYDIDRKDSIYLTTFSMFADEPRSHPCALSSLFDIIYLVADYDIKGMKESDIDLVKNRAMLPNNCIGILQERAQLTMGYALDRLWSGSRTVPTANDYQVYEEDTPLRYTTDQYELDEYGAPKIRVEDGEVTWNIIAKAGDIVYDENEQIIYEGRKGDLKRDANGDPVLVNGRELARQLSIMFVDGIYYFATNSSSVAYKKYLAEMVKTWVLDEMGSLNKIMFEKSSLYFYPRGTIGNVNAIVGEGEEVVLPALQSFAVKLYLNELGYKNTMLKQTLTRMVVTTIANALNGSTVTTKDIIDQINEQGGADLLGIEFAGLGGSKNYSVVTMRDNSGRFAISKKLVALSDGAFGVEEDVEVAFVRHLPARSDA